MIQRRTLLATTPALLLVACQQGTSTKTQLQTIAGLATAGIDAVGASVLATPGLAADTASKINAAVATVNSANAVIQGATATVGANAQQIVSAIRMAAPLLLANVNASSNEAIAINAAVALLPTILAAAGAPAPAPTAAMAHGAPVAMKAEDATRFLHSYTGK